MVDSTHDCTPIPRLRHYFIKHLFDVVKRNAKHKQEVETQNANSRPVKFDNRSAKSTGLIQRPRPPPSSHAIRRVDEAPQPILSTDWNSGKFPFDDGICANVSLSFSDSHPASGLSVTLSPDVPEVIPAVPYRPLQIQRHSTISRVSRRFFPRFHRKVKRTVTMPRTATLLPADTVRTTQGPHEYSTVVPYLSFPTIVGRNSVFHGLTEDQLEELGGIEFRALNMLMWAVPLVCHCTVADCAGPR